MSEMNVEEQNLPYAPERAEQLLQNYRRVLERIRAAEQDHSAVRTEASAPVQLVTVTKFFPASDAAALLDGGVTLFGENRDQEASAKARELATYCAQREVQPPHWAFIGQLQTNKAKSVVKYASSVHSVDRPSLADALAKAYANQLARFEAGEAPAPAAAEQGALTCLVQVSLAEVATAGHAAEGARGGTSASELLELVERIENHEHLRCGGVMAVAPLGMNPDEAFEKLYGLASLVREQVPHATEISAGMSGDLEAAVRWGSTCVRVGSDIMGKRPAL